MFQKFNTNTIESKFIKNLVATTYTPLVQIWKPGKPIHRDFTYISKNYILKCIKTYNPTIDGSGPQSENDANYFNIIGPYIRGKFYPGLTTNHISNNSEYDSKTLYHLGQYLRYQRDINNLDLMAYYNCWCGEYSDKIRVKNLTLSEIPTIYNGEIISDNKNQDGYKLLKIPIKYNQKYTIFVNSNTPFIVGYVYSNNDRIISKGLNFKYVTRCSFEDPYVYEGVSNLIDITNNSVDSEYIYENYLTMIIQLPVTTSNKILILEGDYKNNKLVSWYKGDKVFVNQINNPEIIYGDKLSYIENYDINKECMVVPSLTRKIKDSTYAFSDRLIEYLLLNVIDNCDEIYQNISRIQKYASSTINKEFNDSIYTESYIKGEWDNKLRKYLYDLTTKNIKTPTTVDISGYVDKDVETIITRGQNV